MIRLIMGSGFLNFFTEKGLEFKVLSSSLEPKHQFRLFINYKHMKQDI